MHFDAYLGCSPLCLRMSILLKATFGNHTKYGRETVYHWQTNGYFLAILKLNISLRNVYNHLGSCKSSFNNAGGVSNEREHCPIGRLDGKVLFDATQEGFYKFHIVWPKMDLHLAWVNIKQSCALGGSHCCSDGFDHLQWRQEHQLGRHSHFEGDNNTMSLVIEQEFHRPVLEVSKCL